MGLKTKKSGTSFGTVASVNSSGHIAPGAVASWIVEAAESLKVKITARQVAEGLGVVSAESGFNGNSKPTGNEHIGLWALGSSYGSESQRLNPEIATYLAVKGWLSDGKNWWKAWGNYETGETEGPGPNRYPKYMQTAQRALQSGGNGGGGGGLTGVIGEAGEAIGNIPGDIAGAVTAPFKAALNAEEFLGEVAETLLNFEKLGSLAVHAFAWFLRLLAKAIWDYVLAPVVHWTERAVTWYWTNFFVTGTEPGSGFGYQIRNNAGIITIIFWSVGYAILWSDGSGGMMPVASHNSMLGQAVRGIEGQVARRNLTKPSDVEKKTVKPPEPKKSTVMIERVDTFAVSRKRPVKVSRPSESVTGRKQNGEQRYRVPRPTSKQKARGQIEQTSRIQKQNGTPKETKAEAPSGEDRTGAVSDSTGSPRSKRNQGGSRKERVAA